MLDKTLMGISNEPSLFFKYCKCYYTFNIACQTS